MHSPGHNVSAMPVAQSPDTHMRFATVSWDRLWPVALAVQHDVGSVCAPIIAHMQPHFQRATAWADEQLGRLHPWQIAVSAVVGTWLLLTLYRWVTDIVADVRDVGERSCSLFAAHTAVPC